MEWHSNLLRPSFAPRSSAENSFNFLFNCSNLDSLPGLDMKQSEIMMAAGAHMGMPPMERSGGYGGGGGSMESCLSSQFLLGDKKKRLTSEQLESLENNFQEEIKLEPERKLKLARELGLQPRQVAVWFQNRRARWKTKQLERLYDSLKIEFDAMSREKEKLQDEVVKLRAMLIEQATRNNHNNKQVSVGCTEVSGGDETVESTSAAGQGVAPGAQECQTYMLSGIEEYNTIVSPPLVPYWAALPTTYPC